MKWLIVEDGLRSRQGHWLEFVQTFKEGLIELADHVEIVVPEDCDRDIVAELMVEPILPRSIWTRRRRSLNTLNMLSMFKWVGESFNVLAGRLPQTPAETIIFVPTVGIPHLILWRLLLLFRRVPRRVRVLLYFMSTPVKLTASGKAAPWGVSGNFFFLILRSMAAFSRSGSSLLLATETLSLSNALSDLSGARFMTLPQPVRTMVERLEIPPSGSIVIGSYGPARYEKGSDLMISAIQEFLSHTTRRDITFAVQWTDDFLTEDGATATIGCILKDDPRFVQIDHLFAPGEYAEWLHRTSLMLLPYRDDYVLRGSRVVLEAIVHGIPVLVSKGTTLEEHMNSFGSGVAIGIQNPGDICAALETAISQLDELADVAAAKKDIACKYFSVAQFRHLLLESYVSPDSRSQWTPSS